MSASRGELIRRAQGGDAQAFGALYEEFLDPIYRYVYFKVSGREDAEDLTERVFLKVWEKLGTFTPQGPDGQGFSAWLHRTAHNTVIDHYRKSKDEVPLSEPGRQVSELALDPEETVADHLEIQEVRRAIGELSEDERQVILLRFVEGLPHKETAEILGQSEVGSRVLQHRALKKLRQVLREPEGEHGGD